MMKQSLHLTTKLQQELRLTPELRQSIELLRYSTMDLIEFINEQLSENPVLEAQDRSKHVEIKQEDAETTERKEQEIYAGTYESPYRSRKSNNDEEYSFLNYVAKEETLIEHLIDQLNMSFLTKRQKRIGMTILAAIDDNGYLCEDLSCLVFEDAVDADEVLDVLRVIQTFEPAGVGARCLSECLMLQIPPERELAKTIVKNNLEDIASNKIQKIAKDYGVTPEQVSDEIAYIKSLNPKPGMSFAGDVATKFVVPDAKIEFHNDRLIVLMNNDNIPNLYMNSMYTSLATSEDTEVAKFVTGRMNSANWLMKSIEQRQSTIRRILSVIVDNQEDFFRKGEKHLAPMTQKQVADEIGIHESTVCRATTDKYVETPMGVFELKYFFSSNIDCTSGDGVFSTSVKAHLQELIEEENKKKPYSDEKLRKLLFAKGIEISRRTIAKYREDLNIPNSALRKQF